MFLIPRLVPLVYLLSFCEFFGEIFRNTNILFANLIQGIELRLKRYSISAFIRVRTITDWLELECANNKNQRTNG